MNITYMAGDVDVVRGATVTTSTTIIAAATIIIIATRAIVAVFLAWTVLASPIIIARPIILAGTTVVVAGAVLLALLLTWVGAIIMVGAIVAASHVGRGGKPRLIGLVLPVEGLYLSEKFGEGGVGIGIDSSTEVVVVTPEALQDVVDELIFIERFSHRGKLSGNTLHLGNIFFRGQITFARVVEGRAKLLDPSFGLAGDMGVEGCPNSGRGVEADDVSEHIGRQRIEKPAQNLLITGDPRLVVGIDDGDRLVVGILGGDGLSGCLVLTLNQIKETGAARESPVPSIRARFHA
jgi:hypothetical protein